MIRLICLGIIKLGMPVCMGVNPTLSYGHSILMIPSVKVVVKRYFDMFLRFVVLFVFIIAVGLIF
jgi:hypothetical protein